MTVTLDKIDLALLKLVQENATLSVADLSQAVGLSASPCWRRLKRLEDTGIIKRKISLLDATQLGLDFDVFAAVKLSLPSKAHLEEFELRLKEWPEVIFCATVTGHEDYLLRIRTTDMHAYDAFLREKLLASDLVSGVESRILMRSVKDDPYVPLSLIKPSETSQAEKS